VLDTFKSLGQGGKELHELQMLYHHIIYVEKHASITFFEPIYELQYKLRKNYYNIEEMKKGGVEYDKSEKL